MSAARRAVAAAAGGVLLAAAAAGCGSTGITPGALQSSISRTFANLYVVAQGDQGEPRPTAQSLAATAICRRGGAASAQSGAGADWTCGITYRLAGLTTSVTATYDVNLQTDGCYAASADGPATVNTPAGPQEVGEQSRYLTTPAHKEILNPLWLINSCFDVT